MRHSFLQQVFITVFCGFIAAGLIFFYHQVIYKANDDLKPKAPKETSKRIQSADPLQQTR